MFVFKRGFHNFWPDKRIQYSARKLVGFSKLQMYTVVIDVKNYNKFVPFCTKSKVFKDTPEMLKANLSIGFPPIVENYTSTVTFVKPNLVKAICRDGKLFTSLETGWRFSQGLKSNPQSCIVDFSVDFEFRSGFYHQIATIFFEQLVERMEAAFISEAKRRFGSESLPVHPLSIPGS